MQYRGFPLSRWGFTPRATWSKPPEKEESTGSPERGQPTPARRAAKENPRHHDHHGEVFLSDSCVAESAEHGMGRQIRSILGANTHEGLRQIRPPQIVAK